MNRLASIVVLASFIATSAGGTVAGTSPDLQVASVTGATKWLVAGETASATARVVNQGDAGASKMQVSLILAAGLPGGPGLAPGATVASLPPGDSAQTKVSGKVPSHTRPAAYSLFVCADPQDKIEEADDDNNCQRAGTLHVSGPGALDRISAAVASGELSEGKGALYRFYAVTGDKRLPAPFRGPVEGAVDDFAKPATADFGSFTAAEKRAVLPYLLPPRAADSAWPSTAGAAPEAARRTAGQQGGLCRGFDNLSRPGWKSVASSNGKALVWYEEADAAAAASAATYASALGTTIWPKLVAEFGPPKPDGGEGCYHGPDGRVDIYVSRMLTALAADSRHPIGVTMAYPADGPFPVSGKFCTNRPAWIAIQPGMSEWVLAHEFMHVLQFAHTYKTCDGVAWWDEGQATWAADFVYKEADNEHNFRGQFAFGGGVAKFGLYAEDYSAWPFWYFLAKTRGIGVLKNIFTALKTADSATAVNRAIPGGMKAQLKLYAIHNWNDKPIGTSGFPVRKSYRDATWDSFDTNPFPWTRAEQEATLRLFDRDKPFCFHVANPTRVDCRTNGRLLEPAQTEFQVLDATDRNIEEITIKNALYRARSGDGGQVTTSLQAMIRNREGKWRLEDWSNKKEITLCRSIKEEDFSQIVLVQANAYVGDITTMGAGKGVAGRFEVRVRDSCDLFFRVTGGRATEGTGGTFRLQGHPCVTKTKLDGPLKWTFAASAAGKIDMKIQVSQHGVSGALGAAGEVEFPGGTQTAPGCAPATMSSVTFKAGPTAIVIPGSTVESIKMRFNDLVGMRFLPDPPEGEDERPFAGVPFSCNMPLDKPPPGTIQQAVPIETLRSRDPFTLKVSASWNFRHGSATIGQDCKNTYSYSVDLQRVNEDGSPLE